MIWMVIVSVAALFIFKLRIVETNVAHESSLEMCQNYKQTHLACPRTTLHIALQGPFVLADFGPIGD